MNIYISNKKAYLALGSGLNDVSNVMIDLIGSYLGLVDTVYRDNDTTPSIRENCEYVCSDKIYIEKQNVVSNKYQDTICKRRPDPNNVNNTTLEETDKCTALIAKKDNNIACVVSPNDCIYRFTVDGIYPNKFDNKDYKMIENILCPMFCGDPGQKNRVYKRDNKYYVVFGWGSGLAYEDMIPFFIVCLKFINNVLLKYMDGSHEIVFMGHSAGMNATFMITQLFVMLSIPELREKITKDIFSYISQETGYNYQTQTRRLADSTNEFSYYRSGVFNYENNDIMQNETRNDLQTTINYINNNIEYIKNSVYVIGSGGKPILNIFCPVNTYMSFFKHQPIQFINTVYHDDKRYIDSHVTNIKSADTTIVYKNIPSYVLQDDSYIFTDYDDYKKIYSVTPDNNLDSEIHAFRSYRNKLSKIIKNML